MVPGQKKPATSQRKRAEVTLGVVGRAILGPHLPTLGYEREFTSGAAPRPQGGSHVGHAP